MIARYFLANKKDIIGIEIPNDMGLALVCSELSDSDVFDTTEEAIEVSVTVIGGLFLEILNSVQLFDTTIPPNIYSVGANGNILFMGVGKDANASDAMTLKSKIDGYNPACSGYICVDDEELKHIAYNVGQGKKISINNKAVFFQPDHEEIGCNYEMHACNYKMDKISADGAYSCVGNGEDPQAPNGQIFIVNYGLEKLYDEKDGIQINGIAVPKKKMALKRNVAIELPIVYAGYKMSSLRDFYDIKRSGISLKNGKVVKRKGSFYLVLEYGQEPQLLDFCESPIFWEDLENDEVLINDTQRA